MRSLCVISVIFIILELSDAGHLREISLRAGGRTPFFQRLRQARPFIVGGKPADIADHPHHLIIIDLYFGGYICGASNINRHFAISAAHCLEFGHPANVVC